MFAQYSLNRNEKRQTDGVACCPTSDVAAVGNHSPALEVLVGLRVHHQQPGLVAACFDEGHYVRVLHGLDVDAVDLQRDMDGGVF